MNKNQNKFTLPKSAKSGSQWTKKTFPEIKSQYKETTEKYITIKSISILLKSLQKEFGKLYGIMLFLKYLTLGYLFYKPKWQPKLFNFTSPRQEAYYKKEYKTDFIHIIIIFEILKKKYGADEADEMVARILMPMTVHFLGLTFKPNDGYSSANPWWEKGVEYIADIAEYGLEGYVYDAKDRSEILWNSKKCVLFDILSAHGLHKTCACTCAGDHIAAHVLYPGIVFERKHCMSVGDSFCDHHAYPKTLKDIGNEDAQFGDCDKMDGLTEFVKSWEDYAKCYWFGSIEKWQVFADSIYKKIREQNK
ncbi:MAG: L-2-amino-thiazoline-4-carboxylic acid hydrolase [Clostridiales bacterium]|nr:L-2-amino-thiazoline-4-carboxylic acid hydrolase [Clostridiales bacterium]